MNRTVKILIVSMLIILIAAVVTIKQKNKAAPVSSPIQTDGTAENTSAPADSAPQPAAALPMMIDLGAGKCIPCKAMKPILDDLAQNYKDAFETRFIDVWENPQQAEQYGIELIPTQIFFDSQGKELFRHQGFFSKEDILAKWKEFGVKLD